MTTSLKTRQKVAVTSLITFTMLVLASSVVIGSFAAGIAGSSVNLSAKKAQRRSKAKAVRQVQQAKIKADVLGENVLLKQFDKNAQRPRQRLLDEQNSQIVFNVAISEVNKKEVNLKNQLPCTQLSIPGAGLTANVGYPELPAVTTYLEIPYGPGFNDMKAEVGYSHFEIFQVDVVCPAQLPEPDMEGASKPLVMDQAAYEQDSFFPESLVFLHKPKVLRKHRILPVTTYPVQYNPATKELKVYYDLDVKTSFANSSSASNFKTDPRYQAGPVLEMVNNLVLNPELPTKEEKAKAESKALTVVGADYLIITPELFLEGLEPNPIEEVLIPHKQGKGLSVYMATLAEIEEQQGGKTADHIAAYIKSAYDNWHPAPLYVLLVGDVGLFAGIGEPTDYIPVHYKHSHPSDDRYDYESPVGSDLYYATVDHEGDPEEYWPDLFVGRLPARDIFELHTMIEKIVAYENYVPTGEIWENRALFAAYNESGRYFIDTSEEIADHLTGEEGYNVTKVYSGSGYSGTTQNVINAINSGVVLVNHRDHGNSTNGGGYGEGWGHPDFDIEHVPQLANEGKLPVFFSMNCRTGWFDGETDAHEGYTVDSLGEALLKKDNAGAIGFIGSTRVSYSGYNDELDKGLADAIWPSFNPEYGHAQSGVNRLGAVLNAGKFYMYDRYVLADGEPYGFGVVPEHTKVEFEEFHLLGDPALELFFANQDLHISHEIEIDDSPGNDNGVLDRGENVNLIITLRAFHDDAHNVTASIENPSSCVYISSGSQDFGEIFAESQATNILGIRTSGLMSCGPGREASFDLKINADGYQRVARVTMYVYENDYSYSWKIDDSSGGDGDGQIEAGEIIDLDVELWTDHKAKNVTASLHRSDLEGEIVTDDYVTILEPVTSSFGDMEIYEHKNHIFQLAIAEDCPHPHSLNFKLEINETDYTEPVSVVIPSIFTYYNGWPLIYKEKNSHNSRVADIDPDYPGLEISFNNDEYYMGVLHSDASLYWDSSPYGSIYTGRAIGDLDHDGDLEIAVSTPSECTVGDVSMFDHDGPLTGHTREFSYFMSVGTPFGEPAMANIDTSTDDLEILMGSDDGHVHCIDKEGELVWESPRLDPDDNPETDDYLDQDSFAVADINFDNKPEIIAAVRTGMVVGEIVCRLYVLNNEGEVVWKGPSWERCMNGPPVVVDLDPTQPGLDIIVGVSNYPYGDNLIAYHADEGEESLRELWRADTYTSSPIVIAEIDATSPGPEIITTSYHFKMYSARGEELAGYSLAPGEGFAAQSPTLVADVDGDSEPEILKVYTKGVIVLNHDFTLYKKIDYDLETTYSNYLIHVGDILAGERAGKVEALYIDRDLDFMDVILFEGDHDPEKSFWPTFQHDTRNTGCFSECPDLDEDGYAAGCDYCGPTDCDDTNPEINPEAIEVCSNEADDDCDGLIDSADPDCELQAFFEYEIDSSDPFVIHFTDISTPQELIANWFWSFEKISLVGNEETLMLSSREQNPAITFQSGGAYQATLTITDDRGEGAEYSSTIRIRAGETGEPGVIIPEIPPFRP